MLARALRANALRAAAGAAVAGATSLALAEAAKDKRFYEIEGEDALLAFKPAVPYPGWDSNWDDLKLTSRQVAKELGHEWSSKFDYAANIRKLFAEHTDVPETEVDVLVAQSDDLPKLYRQSYAKHAWGGASVRYIVLVRHGQYDEQRALQKAIKKEKGPQATDLDEMLQKDSWERINAGQVLTALGRQQATATGKLLARMLAPALDPEREGDVRIHTSTMTRAQETADLIAAELPPHVRRLPPEKNLSEGEPPALDVPAPYFVTPRGAHVEGSRMEAAYRSLFYRSLPRRRGGGGGGRQQRRADAPVAGRARRRARGRAGARAEQAVPLRVRRRRLPRQRDPVLCAARAPAAAGGVAPPRLVQRQLRAAAHLAALGRRLPRELRQLRPPGARGDDVRDGGGAGALSEVMRVSVWFRNYFIQRTFHSGVFGPPTRPSAARTVRHPVLPERSLPPRRGGPR